MRDDYLLDDLERTQLDATRRRRSNRSRRYYRMLLLALGFLALLALAAPSLVSHTGVARSMLASSAQAYGWTASADSIDVGWITPLSIRGLELVGPSGETVIQIDRADTALTVMELLRLDPAAVGEVSLRGVGLACSVDEGGSSIESDLAPLLEPSDQPASQVSASIQIQDFGATATDSTSGESWSLSQSNVSVTLDGAQISGEIAGVVNEPGGSGGAIQSQFDWQAESAELWKVSLETESFPLSVANLIARRFSGVIDGFPQQVSGDTTGRLQLAGAPDGAIQASLGDVRIRNLRTIVASSGGASTNDGQPQPAPAKQWNNELATLDGNVALSGGWLLGQGLELTTDFASATLDGSFPTTISLVGSDDNPLSWLQALDGKARVDVDLASLDQALPGLIPLRSNVTLVSGRASGIIENTPAPRRSNLTVSSNSLRARADGRIVMIDPIELTATVTDDNGSLRAERFNVTSSFAQASGSGTLQDGMAELQIDFGRLYTMLRPVIDLSDLSLDGTAGGEVKWTVNRSGADQADRWDLLGSGEAKNLLVTLPSGHRFQRAIVQGDVAAKGQWNGRTLEQLTTADLAIRSGGVSFGVELMSPVSRPTPDSIYPVRLESDGRLENLSESLRPWLPELLRSAEGRLTGSAIANVSRAGGSLSKAEFVVSQPRINYDSQWYIQQSVTVNFDGVLDWPSGNFSSQELTVRGEALSLAVRGAASREKTNLDIAWNADLKRLQESVGATIARAASTNLVRPISYRPVQEHAYQISGLSSGKLNITGGPVKWDIDASASATNVALHAPSDQRNYPPGTPAGAYGPSPRPTFGQGFGNAAQAELGELIWQEPRVKVDGRLQYNTDSGVVTLPALQLASDGFAGTMAGEVQTGGEALAVQLSGPSRWKMDVVAARLSNLLGTPIQASGIHEAPFEFKWTAATGQSATGQSSTSQNATLIVKGELGWDQCEVADLRIGQTTLPFQMTDQSLKIARTSFPILSLGSPSATTAGATPAEAGQVDLAAQVDYMASPMTVRLSPGAKVKSLKITPSTAAGWLKYLAPLAANATTIDGNIAAEFDEVAFNVDDPYASVVRGRLDVQDMRLSSGPLANQLIQGVEQIKSLARLTGGQAEPASAKTLIEMPPQSVEFSFEDGVATHQRMYFKIDRANLMTSGRVASDSNINLVAQVPLDARWLGSDLKGLAGQTLTFPITGTLDRPKLDDSAVRNVMTELGSKAGAEVIQNRLDGLIQKQLGSGMEQINSGLEKILGF
ncbi:translocation/assembly module TamB domain-containing protein [Stieleria neptunia]|uniref:hypothetical protein n=1 Tax=Stieleria neptunia TaxID=2527979 RepID=UPI0011A64762|nr:hypothetical protein [Stieleria neptunia]